MRKQDVRQKYEEGKSIKDREAMIRKMIEDVRQSKLQMMEGMNIPVKYQAELGRRKF